MPSCLLKNWYFFVSNLNLKNLLAAFLLLVWNNIDGFMLNFLFPLHWDSLIIINSSARILGLEIRPHQPGGVLTSSGSCFFSQKCKSSHKSGLNHHFFLFFSWRTDRYQYRQKIIKNIFDLCLKKGLPFSFSVVKSFKGCYRYLLEYAFYLATFFALALNFVPMNLW